MKFYLIRDIEEERCNGVILESDDLQYGGRLAGSEGVDDPARVIPILLNKNDGKAEVLIGDGDGGRRKTVFKKHEPGYMEAIMGQLQTPLILFRKGRMTNISTPETMTTKLWERFANSNSEMPRYRPL